MDILFIDTETGGLDPNKHSILSIGIAMYSDGNIIEEEQLFIKHDDYVVCGKALEINNISLTDHDRVALNKKIVVQRIIKFIKDNCAGDKPVIAGHNVDFDYKFLDKLFKDEGELLSNYVSHRKIDTCSLLNVLIYTGAVNVKSASLESAIEYFKINTDLRHTAIGDVRSTIILFEHILKILK